MKKTQKKKGFSLIELIIVIAVIAAIAAVIVPSIGNFSDSAKNATDQRNVQTWNSVYANLHNMNQSGVTWATGGEPKLTQAASIDGASVNTISGTYDLAGKDVKFEAPGFELKGSNTTPGWSSSTGVILTH